MSILLKPAQTLRRWRLKLFGSWVLILAFSGLFASCGELLYYKQAVSGHLSLLRKKVPIQELLTRDSTPAELKAKLKLITDVREFAINELHLPDTFGYTEFADLGRSYVSAVVNAAEPLQLKAYEWCFLFVGCVGYRGYFDEAEAKEYAEGLSKQGYDVSIGYVRAYSTLKWLNNDFMPDFFKDPVLNTFTERSDTTIAKTLIHEMSHQVLFVSGDTPFNESFAVFVEQTGLERYLNRKYGSANKFFERYQQKQLDHERFNMLLQIAIDQLNQLYQSNQPNEEKYRQKAKIFEALKQRYEAEKSKFLVDNYDKFFSQSLNNSHLLGVQQYHQYVPAFAQIFQDAGSDWITFLNQIKELAKMDKIARNDYLNKRLPK